MNATIVITKIRRTATTEAVIDWHHRDRFFVSSSSGSYAAQQESFCTSFSNVRAASFNPSAIVR